MRRQYVYIASPIDQAGSDPRLAIWRRAARYELRAHGVVGYDPSTAFVVGADCQANEHVNVINNTALGRSSGLLAVIPKGVPTVGTPMEIERARRHDIPVAVVTDAADQIWALHQWGIQTFDNSRDAVLWLLENLRPDPPEFMTKKLLVTAIPGVDHAGLPSREHDDDAGLDLYVAETATIPPGEFRDVSCGIRIQMPSGMYGRITGRSSTFRKRGLLVLEGIIDGGYRGPIFSGVWNTNSHPVEIKAGERVAQLLVSYNSATDVQPIWTDALDPSRRGEAGFGSTGE